MSALGKSGSPLACSVTAPACGRPSPYFFALRHSYASSRPLAPALCATPPPASRRPFARARCPRAQAAQSARARPSLRRLDPLCDTGAGISPDRHPNSRITQRVCDSFQLTHATRECRTATTHALGAGHHHRQRSRPRIEPRHRTCQEAGRAGHRRHHRPRQACACVAPCRGLSATCCLKGQSESPEARTTG
jgi:hypothetical protein